MKKIIGTDKMDFIGNNGGVYTCGLMIEFYEDKINAICYFIFNH